MNDYFKYLTPGEEDKNWGLYLTVAGKAFVPPHTDYPSSLHPSSYYFRWEGGRILDEFQINYITEGEGVLETRDGEFKITKGSVFLIYPGVWHRYRPLKKNGWNEHYIGFNGNFTEYLYKHELLSGSSPVLKVGFQESLLQVFNDIYILVKQERPGFQHECAGKLVFLLARIVSTIKNSEFAGKEIERNIRRSCIYLRDNIDKNIDMEVMAHEMNVSYSYFRRMFKKYTGNSPGQYHLSLKILRAKELIISTEMRIKDIAYSMGFESVHYFSRIFKEKTGHSPSELRVNNF